MMNVWRIGTKWGPTPVFDIMVDARIAFWNKKDEEDENEFPPSIQHGDLVALAEPGTRRILAIGEVSSNVGIVKNYREGNCRENDLTDYDGAWAVRMSRLYRLLPCEIFSSADYKRFYSLSNDPAAYNETIRLFNHRKENEKMDDLCNLLKSAKQIVLTGAPGTGKTYLARQIARSIVLKEAENKLSQKEIDKLVEERTSFVQFHPSYDYTDFVEGLRPIQGADGQVGFKRQDGEFMKLCKIAIKDVIGEEDNFDEAWDALLDMIEDSDENRIDIPYLTKNATFPVEINKTGDGLASRLYDETQPDGYVHGRSKFMNKEQLQRVYHGQAGTPKRGHDNYRKAIVEFMKKECGLKPYVAGKPKSADERCKYVMIIDEINRGDISKIFGELFYAIDGGYRGAKGKVKTQYQNLVGKNDPFFNGFYVPENVYIIGTMNDIDRNVESMDFAIRRRFAWKEIKPEDRFDAMMFGLKDYTGTAIPEEIVKQAKERMDGLNSAICEKKYGLGSAYQIGPSYFMKIADYAGDASVRFEALWAHHLKPLLMEYLRGMPNADGTLVELEQAYKRGKADNV